MDYKEELAKLNEAWETKKANLSKLDIKRISGKDSYQGKLFGLFSRAYAVRSKLILSSKIYNGYAFKAYMPALEESEDHYPSWVIYSPSSILNSNPEKLKFIIENLHKISDGEINGKEYKKPKYFLTQKEVENCFYQLPYELTENQVVYLVICYVRPRLNPNFRLGVIPLLANLSVSKETLFLPESYYSDGWQEFLGLKVSPIKD